LIGRTIAGKFAIEELLGSGAMGRVFRARQLALEKPVAIKVLNAALAIDPAFVARFAREAKAAARLDHPNSIRVFDFGREPDGLLYIAMELVSGKDLATEIEEQGRMPPERIANILVQVLAALSVAHEMGVLHRDLKPANVMLVRGRNDDGQAIDLAKVCDFGIAKIVDSSSGPDDARASTHPLTAGLVVGTPEYMAPEQARGAQVDARADVYAVGVILYQMLTARLPFEADTPLSMVIKHVTEAPARPSAVCADVDPSLEAICLKALQKNPSDRFQSASEMRLALAATAARTGATSEPRAAAAAVGTSPSPTVATLERRELGLDDRRSAANAGVTPDKRPGGARFRWLKVLAATAALVAGTAVAARFRHAGKESPPSPPPSDVVNAKTPASAALPAAEATATTEPTATITAIATIAPEPSAIRPLPSSVPATKTVRGKVPPIAEGPSKVATTESAAAPPAPEERLPTPATAEAPVSAPPPAPSPPPAVAPPASPPIVEQPAAAPPPPRFDLSSARVVVEPAVRVTGTTASAVGRAVAGAAAQLTACYRAALPQLSGPVEGEGVLHIDTDGAGAIVDARFAGPLGQSIQRCAAPAVVGRRVANVDTGSASADIPLVFKPR
jgi:serine/threonine-protein kinase